eukprot:TRINITY_DN3143_c0_g1_i9.p1 TRINITY_DN3143_c0_g1~~TRINITY_DN3143_c0_g1_i9.p1  ORF type:complete len:110 (-),score=5.62 TRINITY_DN3143_c0_g1_i9:291-620(-)
MGNFVTRKLSSYGTNLLAIANRGSADTVRRRTFFGHELINIRTVYEEYRLGLREFKQDWKVGLNGRDLGGLMVTTLFFFAGYTVGETYGSGDFEPLRLPTTKYPELTEH